jgi:hypothetical protein
MRRQHVHGLVERSRGGRLDACSGDRGHRPHGQRGGEPFLARRHSGEFDRAQAMPLLLR